MSTEALEFEKYKKFSPKLTTAEECLVKKLNKQFKNDPAGALSELKTNLQTAIEIELATIPIYLYTYYSIIRNKELGEQISPAQLFANKAGGVIMSVAVEEMLHMSLASNILFSLGEEPQLYKKAPGPYPTGLPYHNPVGPKGPGGSTKVAIPLAKLSYEQLWHFLQIEYPETKDALPEDRNWETIGQFYSYIRCLICTDYITDKNFWKGSAQNQIQPENYSQNNVDTVHPSTPFNPWKPAPPGPLPSWAKNINTSASSVAVYSNLPDSHAGPDELITVSSRIEALNAIETICEQGEGYAKIGKSVEEWDDPSKREESHYFKFLTLQAQFEQYTSGKEVLAKKPKPPAAIEPSYSQKKLINAGILVDVPDNPVTANYPAELQPISNFLNGLFQYMLVMTETIYRVPPEEQKLFFNEGLHRSMIWVMDKYIQTIRQIPVDSGPYKGKFMGPTFENVDLGPQKDSFTALTNLGNAAIAAVNRTVSAKQLQGGPAEDSLISVLNNVTYYVEVAISANGPDGHPRHLPDVAPYW